MNIKDLKHWLAAIGLAACATLIAPPSAGAEKAATKASPNRDIAVVDIPHPRQGNLLMLRGFAGRGTATFRISGTCHTMPVRFVAGDFSGQNVDVARAGPIRIVIITPRVIHDLLKGSDLVSDMVRVTSDSEDTTADLYLEDGLSADTGFVINPGRNLTADILGAGSDAVDCASLATTLP